MIKKSPCPKRNDSTEKDMYLPQRRAEHYRKERENSPQIAQQDQDAARQARRGLRHRPRVLPVHGNHNGRSIKVLD
jgi:hypothetical protein